MSTVGRSSLCERDMFPQRPLYSWFVVTARTVLELLQPQTWNGFRMQQRQIHAGPGGASSPRALNLSSAYLNSVLSIAKSSCLPDHTISITYFYCISTAQESLKLDTISYMQTILLLFWGFFHY